MVVQHPQTQILKHNRKLIPGGQLEEGNNTVIILSTKADAIMKKEQEKNASLSMSKPQCVKVD